MNVLFLSHRLPYAPNRGDRVRAFNLLREITKWADVDLISLVHDAGEASHAQDLRGTVRSVRIARVSKLPNLVRAIGSLPSSVPTTHSMLHARLFGHQIDELASAAKPDVVLSFCTGVTPGSMRPSLAGVPLILDMVDVDSEKWASMSASAPPPLSWVYAREARVLSAFEATAAMRARATLVVNDKERQALLALAPRATVQVVENGIDVSAFRPQSGPATKPIVVFCGVMNYGPNVEGAIWLAQEVWSKVRSRVPAAELHIVGASPSRPVLALADASAGVTVKGSVPDVRPHLWSAAVAAAPLQTARGVQNKVLEAAAAGLPVVVTPVVMEGLPVEVHSACSEAASPQAFADRLVDWLNAPAEARRAAADSARLDAITWERRLAGLRQIFTAAADRR